METIHARLTYFIQNQGITKHALEHAIGVSNGLIGTHLRKGSYFGVDIAIKILDAYPYLSAEWLMRGEGDMIRTGPTDILYDNKTGALGFLATAEPQATYDRSAFEARKEIAELRQMLSEKQSHILAQGAQISQLIEIAMHLKSSVDKQKV